MTSSSALRDPDLKDFLHNLIPALLKVANATEAALLGRIFAALEIFGKPGHLQAQRLPVCAHLPRALSNATSHSSALSGVANAFAALEPRLCWAPRASGGPHASENWPIGHANATIVGHGGLEAHDDVLIGASLLAPHVRYPDHRHPPEEIYLVLSPGRFKHGASSWVEPGVGGCFHNTPEIEHAMASDAEPLLAVWCLWTG